MSKLRSIGILRQEDKEFFNSFPIVFWLIFIIFGILLTVPVLIYIGFSADAYSGNGQGTSDNPYQISNCNQLQEVKDNNSAYYILVSDVDCTDTSNWNSGAGFQPINTFTGNIDGRNHAIVGLYINRPSEYAVGLVSFFNGGTIKNIRFLNGTNTQNQDAVVGGRNVGLVAAEVRGTARVENVHSDLNVKGATDGTASSVGVGGLAGLNRGVIYRSSNNGLVSLRDVGLTGLLPTLGGLVGYMDDNEGDTGTIESSYSTGGVSLGEVEASSVTSITCGGLVGSVGALSVVKTSYSTSEINCNTGQYLSAGGLIGYLSADGSVEDNERIIHNFASGQNLSQNGAVGGLVGGLSDFNKDLSTNYFDITGTNQTECVNGASGKCNGVNAGNSQPNYFKDNNTPLFYNWDQGGVWYFDLINYPALQTVQISPDAPFNLNAVRSETDFELSWEAPVPLEGRSENIYDYAIEYKIISDENWSGYDDGQSDQTSAIITGLNMSRGYQFRVRAVNYIGNGLYSNFIESNVAAPSKITGLAGTSTAKSVRISWDENTAAMSYVAQYRGVGQTEWSSNGLDLDTVGRYFYVAPLDSSTSYEFRVAGTNDGGQGEWSDIFSISTEAQQNYTITNCQQLQEMANDVSGNYTLANNVDCSETENWNDGKGFVAVGQIGTTDEPFLGTLNGNNFTIDGLYINAEVVNTRQTYTGIGLFGVVIGGRIENLRMNNTTVSATYALDPSVDQNQNGIPDGEDINTNPNEIIQYDQNDIAQEANDVLGFGDSFGKVAVGTVAGVVSGGGTMTNIRSDNVGVIGGIAGGVFGNVAPYDFLRESPEAITIDFNSKAVTFSNIQSSGFVNGILAGGIIGQSLTLPTSIGGQGLTMTNVSSSADVDGNGAGGLVGGAVDLGFLSPILTLGTSQAPDLSIIPSIATAATDASGLKISNSYSTGSVSTCDAVSQIPLGTIGGVAGFIMGGRVENTYSTGQVSVCSSQITGGFAAYGGSMGGLIGTSLFSQIDNSYATGQVGTIQNPDIAFDVQNNVFPAVMIGSTGGLVGSMVSLGDGQSGPVVNNSYASGEVSNVAGVGMVAVNGGLIGTFIGGGTIQSSSGRADVESNLSEFSVGAGNASGGLVGVAVGVDALSTLSAIFAGEPTPTNGLVINNSYASGNVTVTREKDGIYAAIQGGLTGLMAGKGAILNSRATGQVTNNLNNGFKLNTITPNIQQNNGLSISGGLMGVGLGVDGQQYVGALLGYEVEDTPGILVDNSYASGDVNGTIAGGLAGYADLKMKFNKVYAEGDVRGTTVGGLFGANGVLNTAVAIGLGVSLSGQGGENAAASGIPPAVVVLFSKISNIIGPMEVTNAYSSGNITAVPFTLSVLNPETGEPAGLSPTSLPTVAGGISGLYATPGGKIENVYASGSINVEQPSVIPSLPDSVQVPNLPSATGGLFGVLLAVPQPDLNVVINEPIVPEEGQSFTDIYEPYFLRPTEIKNTFSASSINTTNTTTSGSFAGLSLSPLSPAFQDAVPLDAITRSQGYYYDKQKVGFEQCSGPTDGRNLVKDGLDGLVVPDGTLDLNDPQSQATQSVYDQLKGASQTDEDYDALYNAYISLAFKSLNCSAVNQNNSQPSYFINNNTNAPMNTWDFSSVWVTRKNDYPKFTAGPESPNPTPVPEEPGVTPINPVSSDTTGPGQVGGAGTPRPILAEVLNPDKVKGQKDNWLIALVKRIPEPVAKTIPYSLLLILIAIAVVYIYTTLLENHRRRNLKLLIKRIYSSARARSTYLSIISHYLNTPITKIKSTVELLAGTKKLAPETIKKVNAEVSKLNQSTDALLNMAQSLTMAQKSEIRKLESIKLPTVIMKPAVWLPLAVLYTLTLLFNVLFVLADRYDVTGMLVLTQLTLGAIAGATLVISYYYFTNARKITKMFDRQADIEKSTASQQGQFINNVYSALRDELAGLELYEAEIGVIPKTAGFKAGMTELRTVVDKMDKISVLSRNVPGLKWQTNGTASVKEAVASVKGKADAANVTIQLNNKPLPFLNIDETSLRHLLSAPIDNAVKFSKAGTKVEISAQYIDDAAVFSVVDHGTGISAKYLAQLFEPFSRFETTEQFDHQGMGLDLYLCQVITEHYGGSIVLVSEEGKGTTARIKVPVTT